MVLSRRMFNWGQLPKHVPRCEPERVLSYSSPLTTLKLGVTRGALVKRLSGVTTRVSLSQLSCCFGYEHLISEYIFSVTYSQRSFGKSRAGAAFETHTPGASLKVG